MRVSLFVAVFFASLFYPEFAVVILEKTGLLGTYPKLIMKINHFSALEGKDHNQKDFRSKAARYCDGWS